MATASEDLSSKYGQGCPICLDMFTSPRQLPCLHSFCEHCLQDYITNKASCAVGAFKEFMCPICRAVTRPAKKDKPVGKWASLFTQSPISLTAESEVKVERPCNICSSENTSNIATKFCVVCEEFMCENCSFCHQKMKMSRTHQMMAIEEWENNSENRMKFAEGFSCPEHAEKEIEFFCKAHDVACCGACSFLHHKTCKGVLDLMKNLPDLLKEMNPQTIMEQMTNFEDHLKKFMERNESNIGTLESQMNVLTTEINKIRKKINTMLDDIEKFVKHEGNRLYKEEMIRKQEQNHQCQSLINAIANSHSLLETVSQQGTDTQMFLVTSKTMKQLQFYSDRVRENFEKVDSIRITLDLDSHLKALLTQDETSLVKVACKEKSESFLCTGNLRPLRERLVELSKVTDVQYLGGKKVECTGLVQLQGGELVLVECKSNRCCLFDSSYNFITSHPLSSAPYNMCLVNDHEVVITLPEKKQVQFLSIKDCSISDTGVVATRYLCFSVDVVGMTEIVVSGPCSSKYYYANNKCYWSLITRDGKEKIHHEFDCQETYEACIALDTSKSCVNICVRATHTLYCFGLIDGKKHFAYTSNNLKLPIAVAVDKESNIYVVGCQSNNIHKLSPDGFVLQVITSGVPKSPYRIAFTDSQDQFILTSASNEGRGTIHHFKHK